MSVTDDPSGSERRLYTFTARFEELKSNWLGSELVRWEMSGHFEGPASATYGDYGLPQRPSADRP